MFGAALAIQFIVAFAILLPRYQAGLITTGDIVLLGALLMQLNRPFEMIGNSIDGLLRAYSQFQPFTFMWSSPEEGDARSGGFAGQRRAGSAFEDVELRLRQGRRWSRTSASQRERGELNFLVGETGSGKTTLFKLALKSLEPQEGRVTGRRRRPQG